MKVSRFVAWILVLALAINPLLLAGAPARADVRAADPLPTDIQQIALNLDRVEPQSFPEAASTDSFSFLRQKIRMHSEGEEHVFDISLPPEIKGIADFNRDVGVEYNPATKTLSLVNHGKTAILYHDFENLDVAAFARDREFLIVVERSGQVWGADMGLAARTAFQGPLPMIKLLRLPENLVQGSLSGSFLTRGTPVRNIRDDALVPEDMDVALTAGDFALVSDSHVTAVLDRDVMRSQIYTSEVILSVLTGIVAPSEETIRLLNSSIKPAQVTTDPAAAASRLSEVEKNVLRSLPPNMLLEVLARSKVNQGAQNERRDRYTFEQWKASYAQLALQAGEKRDFSQDWQALTEEQLGIRVKKTLWKSLTTKSLKILKIVLAGGAAGLAAKGILNGSGPAWAVSFANDLYDKYWPEALKDAAYRVTLLKSTLLMGAFVPAIYGIGALAGRTLFPGWSAQKAQAKMGMIMYGIVSRPFFHYVAALARQKNFVASLQRGINPFRKITASDGSTFLAGITNPFLSGIKQMKQVQERRAELDKVAAREGKTENLAFALAAMTFAAEAGTDPATLVLLASKNGVNQETIEKINENPELQKQWYQIAKELTGDLETISDLKGKVADQLAPDELAEAFRLAHEAAVKIKALPKSSLISRNLFGLKQAFYKVGSRTLKSVGNYGVDEAKFLFRAEPSDTIVGQYWRQFCIDFELTVLQMGSFGARADMSVPGDLAADPNGPLFTNRGYLVDLSEDLRQNNVNNPAAMALVFQKEAAIRETNYTPIQEITLQGNIRIESFMKGMWTWTKAAANLANAGYAQIYVTDLVKSLKTMQAILFFSVGSRMLIGHQSFLVAMLATTYVFIWQRWQYNWPWPIISRGNQVYEEITEQKRREFMDLKTDLDQAMKLDQSEDTARAIVKLVEFSEGETADLPEVLQSFKDEIKSLLDSNPNVEQIKSVETSLKMNGQMLLDYVLKNPVVASGINNRVQKLTTIAGSIATTYLASTLYADSFHTYTYMEWLGKLGDVGIWSAAIYATLYTAEKYVLPKIVERWKSNSSGPLSCQKIFDLR